MDYGKIHTDTEIIYWINIISYDVFNMIKLHTLRMYYLECVRRV